MLIGMYEIRVFAKVIYSGFPDLENFTYFNLSIIDKFTLNTGVPEFIGEMPDFVMEANSTKSFKLPNILD